MVSVIKSSASLRNVLYYNENKLKQKVAELIHSSGFTKDAERLSFKDKLKTFEKRMELNQRTRLKTVHISLNFHPDEKLNKEQLKDIADAYMQKIGFGDQPYLVYQHFDAGHPHIHLVTTNIKNDGARIKMQNIGRNQSTKARLEIEKEFWLKPATQADLKRVYELKPVNATKVQYGRTETKRAITNVLDYVLPKYKYASLPELNAVLRQYNVLADRGGKTSRIFKNGGLVYRVLNERGEKVGVPVKASDIYNQPTLATLQQKFDENKVEKQNLKVRQRLRNAIDIFLTGSTQPSLLHLINSLKQKNIEVVLRQNEASRIYGITYVDKETKFVFNGSELGKQYAASGLLQRLDNTISVNDKPKQAQQVKETQENDLPVSTQTLQKVLDILFKEEYTGTLSNELQNELKRRRRKRLRLE
ncbi:MAG: relaxase [Chitinophagaceae bacterium]|nr:MAG: relaxase [Chitinophagaceae bacterium]